MIGNGGSDRTGGKVRERDVPRSGRVRGLRDDAGIATVFTCLCVLVLLTAAVLVMYFAAAVLARHRAEMSADLGAVAGARQVIAGSDAACARARTVADANHGRVRSCEVDGADLLLVVTVDVRIGPVRGSATGRARAGPVPEV